MFSLDMFQSQARCQPRGDKLPQTVRLSWDEVSISSEMPAPWRLIPVTAPPGATRGFNLKRDASPVATSHIDYLLNVYSDVSISSEMPAPWRRGEELSFNDAFRGFNLKRDASPVAT